MPRTLKLEGSVRDPIPKEYGLETLGGVRTSREGWEHRLMKSIVDVGLDQREHPSVRAGGGKEVPYKELRQRRNRVDLTITPGFKANLTRAAKSRGISVTGYIRRAVTAFIMHDLDLDFRTANAGNNKPWDFNERTRKRNWIHVEDDGQDYGEWKVEDR